VGVITEWVDKEIEVEAEIEFHAILRQLENTPRELWVRPDYAPLDPEIGEIRVKANRVQHRVFGFFLTEAKQFVMLIGSKKKGKNYIPRDAIDTARKRRKLVLADRSYIHEYTGHKI
jgi:Phage derived protein Gp49-like (DUF891)